MSTLSVRHYVLISNCLSLWAYFYYLLTEIVIISRNWAYINNKKNAIYSLIDNDRPCSLQVFALKITNKIKIIFIIIAFN